MDVNKMRQQFEAAFVKEQVRKCGEGFRSSALYMIEQNVVTVRMAWWAWQASREAVVVELPKPHYEFEGDPAPEMFASQVLAAIKAQGLKVAP